MKPISRMEFAFSDNGRGMDPFDKAHLFDSLYRRKKAVSDQIYGLRIGLRLVKRVAEAHGERADVRNLVEGGAQFPAFIPLEKERF